MLIHLQDLSILTNLAHEAPVHQISTRWPGDALMSVYLRCTLSQPEASQALRDLGIEGQTVEVQFREVLRAESTLVGSGPPGEVIASWDLIRYPEMSSKVIHSGADTHGHLFQHKISCSGGSTLDVVCGQVWLRGMEDDV